METDRPVRVHHPSPTSARKDRQYVATLADVKRHSRARSTGTLVLLMAPGSLESDPETQWMLVCDGHGGCCGWPTAKEAVAFMSCPEEWCDGCQEAAS